jgi:hypothetical protein
LSVAVSCQTLAALPITPERPRAQRGTRGLMGEREAAAEVKPHHRMSEDRAGLFVAGRSDRVGQTF